MNENFLKLLKMINFPVVDRGWETLTQQGLTNHEEIQFLNLIDLILTNKMIGMKLQQL